MNTSHIVAKGISHPGRVRSENEDAIFMDESGHYLFLADGMGGHEYGAVASKTALQVIRNSLMKNTVFSEPIIAQEMEIDFSEAVASAVLAAIRRANSILFNRSYEEGLEHYMGTTLVGLVKVPDSERILWTHVGDSRLYQWRKSTLRCLTLDHSAYVKWVRNGKVGKKPGKNLITRAIGTRNSVTADIGWGRKKKGDVYILCSDGLTDMLPDEQIASVLKAETDVNVIAKHLVDAANEAGGRDNVSVVVCKF